MKRAVAVEGSGASDSFRRGFRNRHPLVLLVAAALLVPALLAVQWLFTSGVWTALPLDTVLRNPKDSFTYISWTVGKAMQDTPTTPTVYLTGGSSARESIVSGGALAAAIKSDGGPRVQAYDLGSINQNFAETLAVATNAPDTPAWVLIGVNLGRFTATKEQNAQQAEGRDLLLSSGAVQAFVSSTWGLQERSYTILPGIWAYVTQWVRSHAGAILHGRAPTTPYSLHRYDSATRRSNHQKRQMVTLWNTTRRPIFERNLDANLQMLDQLLAQARERGVKVVLLELPLNTEVVGDSFATSQRQYQAPVTALAGKYGVPYIDLNKTVTIPSRDFQDLSHLIAPGRTIWQRALARELASLMSASGTGGTGG